MKGVFPTSVATISARTSLQPFISLLFFCVPQPIFLLYTYSFDDLIFLSMFFTATSFFFPNQTLLLTFQFSAETTTKEVGKNE